LRSRFSDLSVQKSAYELLRLWVPNLRVIRLRRQNLVARAISLVRARQTNIWYQSSLRANAPQGIWPPTFNFEEIHLWHCLGGFQEECWQRFFDENGIVPHFVLYEELVANYEATVRGVLKFLDLEADDIPIPPPSSMKQAGTSSEEWEERYHNLCTVAGI
jgi:LPS sulfotransferase NodH